MRNLFSKLALAAIVGIAITFTLSCSYDSNNDGSESSISSSSNASSLSNTSSSSNASSLSNMSSSSSPSSSSGTEIYSSSEILASSSSLRYSSSSSAASSSSSSSSSNIAGMAPLKAQPVAASKNGKPKVLESWIEGGKNWYIIDVGYIDNSLVMETDHERYEGLVEITFTKETTVKTSISENRTTSVSNSIVVSNSSTETVGIEAAIKAAVKAKAFGVEGSIESSLKSNHQISQTVGVSQGRTTATSETLIESFEKSVKDVLTLKLDRNVPVGYYRYAWYTTWDVYFVVSTSLDNQELLSWDVVSCPRGVGTKGLEYSPDNKFDNSPKEGDEIVFADDFYKTLPKPTNVIEEKVAKKEEISFATAGNHTYIFDKGFPATVEIYALGAGGGGQGGNRSHWINANPFKGSVGDRNDIGTGGSGGGGAAAYMKLAAEQPVTFNIKVGKGGSGGGGHYSDWNDTWESGNPGSSGESTSVAVGSVTLVAEGGGGAGGGGQSLIGGMGGRKSTEPASLSDFASEPGKKGSDGQHMADIRGTIQGGQAAMIEKGTEKSFGGGLGARNGVNPQAGGGGLGGYNDNQPGTPGGDGQVIIVVTYFEKEKGL